MEDAFGKYGPITEVKVVTDRDSGRPKGFAFVSFENPGDADAAKEALNGYELLGRPIRVDNSTPKGQGGPRGRDGQIISYYIISPPNIDIHLLITSHIFSLFFKYILFKTFQILT